MANILYGEIEQTILKSMDLFPGFARKRLNDPELAADAVQESLLKALKAADQPTDAEKMIPGFTGFFVEP